ncbi:alanine--tRNA ligase [Holospora obtusa F1]|uniref:Alanine--tRNA ligase n=1 Tax=Holospora obtusa F1 TaxID=1399147 RepID=W6TDA9_HOLOB|nr:alanine--tRNA ligase [Holospora obtusa]ETZ06721.1 alanine--tRNA ligase [Holospora obtusa F1]
MLELTPEIYNEMCIMKIVDIRSAFLDSFQSLGHQIVPSSGLVPDNDPTLLFTTAGMVQFKDILMGKEKRSYSTAVTCQKCVRAGGKHNDLEQVGYTARHHTFFEMLGNFSFSDYFKEHAIEYAWSFLTKHLKIPKEKLYVTVYHTDTQSAQLWKKIANFSDSRILFIKSQDNFWAMGDTGPCGPCSEIFFDHGSHISGGLPGTAQQDGDRFVELWNLVFMQFERTLQGDIPLERPCIDTGMGLERIAAVMQGVHDNFHTDGLYHMIKTSKLLCPNASSKAFSTEDIPHRVLADHVRSASFLMADGVLPSNEGRGYVLRRIVRRALRFGSYINAPLDHLSELAPYLIHDMEKTYPELLRAEALIKKTLLHEAERFEHILAKGMRLIQESKSCIQEGVFPGEKAFQLYDTHGVPIDLIQDILSDEGITVDHEAFEVCLETQKASSRQYSLGSQGSVFRDEETENFWNSVTQAHHPSEFCGYHALEHEDYIQLILDPSEKSPLVELKHSGCVVTQTTPFYAESGGQIGDKGWIKGPHGVMEVSHTEKRNHVFIHHGTMQQGTLKEGDLVILSVDAFYRKKVQSNHSATHLLHSALRHVLGAHVTQKGSLVTPERLRFDFSHIVAMSEEELAQVEEWVNEKIWENLPVKASVMPQDLALKSGAMALFGEKYTQEVRVVSIGTDTKISMELCGGTHVDRTGEIGFFKIIHESSVGSGLRRIEAVTQSAAFQYIQKVTTEQKRMAHLLKTTPLECEEKVRNLFFSSKQPSLISCKVERFLYKNGILAWAIVQNQDHKSIKNWIDTLFSKLEFDTGIFWLVTEDKQSVYLSVQNHCEKKLSALDALKELYHACNIEAKGGGCKNLAQGKWIKEICKINAVHQLANFLS